MVFLLVRMPFLHTIQPINKPKIKRNEEKMFPNNNYRKITNQSQSYVIRSNVIVCGIVIDLQNFVVILVTGGGKKIATNIPRQRIWKCKKTDKITLGLTMAEKKSKLMWESS